MLVELLSAMMKGVEAPNIEIEVEDCEECTVTFSFYVISGSYLSHSPHDGREFWSHFEASQLKEDATAYERRRHLRWKVCEGHDMSPRSDRPMTKGGDTLEKV